MSTCCCCKKNILSCFCTQIQFLKDVKDTFRMKMLTKKI